MENNKINHKTEYTNAFKSLGVVFGDIGTSPIYTLTVVFILLKPTTDNIIGILSLIIWTLTTIVTIKYVWLAMSLSKRGEGGTIVLMEILLRLLKPGKRVAFTLLLAYLGVSLLIGDGIITPAISILSAVEGVRFLPQFAGTLQLDLVFVAAIIAIILFLFQRIGTDKVAVAFAPIMLIWFLALFITGFLYFIQEPWVIKAASPYYALKFFFDNGFIGFLTLSEVILCATGGEALYADMGQLKRRPITKAWCFVFVCLFFNYMGQAVYMIQHPDAKNILFGMVAHKAGFFYLPFLILSIFATVIASQAMITGIFSIVYQAINTRLMPMLKIDYTSPKIREQIYIPIVNWFLLISVVFIMFLFQSSDKLAAAYGLAVTGAMVFAGIMMVMIFQITKHWIKFSFTIFVTTIITIFFASTLFKIPTGGFWSLILSCVPLFIILLYTTGQRKLFKAMRRIDLKHFLVAYNKAYLKQNKIKGTALFMIRDTALIPQYIIHTIFQNDILYEESIFLTIIRKTGPWGVNAEFKKDIAQGLRHFEIRMGYMERESVTELLKDAGIKEKVIFYGIQDIVSRRPLWKLFSIMNKLIPPYVKYYRLSPRKLHGIVSRIEM